MSYEVSQKEMQSVAALPPFQRLQYFLGKVADWRELWGICSDKGWMFMSTDEGKRIFPAWPAEAYAKSWCVDEWSACHPKPIAIDDWMEKWLPGLLKDNVLIAAFPVPDSGRIIVDADEMRRDLSEYLSAYEG